jgi:hypothetical protein
MDPSETQSPPSSRLSAMVLSSSPSDPLAVMASNCSPSEQLSAMILNSSPAQQAPPDASRDAPRDAPTKAPSSRASLFGNGRPSRTPSPPGTPSPLDRRISNKLNRSPSRAHRVDALSDQTSGDFPYLAREPSLPYEAWENVSNTLGQLIELRSAQPANLISGLLRYACYLLV